MSRDEWLRQWPGIRHEEPLARHLQYGIGGPAEWFLDVDDARAIGDLLALCAEANIPVTVLGAGSNALVLDAGVRGLVLTMTEKNLRIVSDDEIELSGGYMMPRAALDCAKKGIAGIEFGIGIPGTCGASVFGNAGAFGCEISDVLLSCDLMSPQGAVRTVSADELGFGYRFSALKTTLVGYIVIAARFRVRHDDPVAVRARVDAIQAQRKATQPYGIRSLGSVFKNPPGDHAGRLIEASGLKGRRSGGAQVDTKHANFIVNTDHATAADVLTLVDLMQREVREKMGVELEREIIIVGEREQAREESHG